jgi:hypothetical protein
MSDVEDGGERPEPSGGDSDSQKLIHKQGWGRKCGGFIKTWKRRWFVLKGLTIHYHVREGGAEKGRIELLDAQKVERAPECKIQPALKIEVPGRVYYMVCDTMEEVDEWIEVMNKVCFPAYLN